MQNVFVCCSQNSKIFELNVKIATNFQLKQYLTFLNIKHKHQM